MKYKIITIIITDEETLPFLYVPETFNILGFNISYMKRKKNVQKYYRYSIEYRVDENRFWYVEEKVIYNEKTMRYEVACNSHHTKNGYKDSIKIIESIFTRYKKCKDIDTGLDIKHELGVFPSWIESIEY